jgi:heme/copper-type cytochrome/quinol oxidase subunit 2
MRRIWTARRLEGLFVLAGLLVMLGPLPVKGHTPVERVVRVEAGGSAFTPAVIHANPGDRITIELVATDVAHALAIDGYPFDLRAEPGQTARASLVVGRPGVFKVRCSLACGNLHPLMTGKLTVGPNLLLARSVALGLLMVLAGTGKAAHRAPGGE